jgi:hypothetical protein
MDFALRSASNSISPEHGAGLLLTVILLLAAVSPVGMVVLAPTIAIVSGADGATTIAWAADQAGCVVAPAYQPPCPSIEPTADGRSLGR